MVKLLDAVIAIAIGFLTLLMWAWYITPMWTWFVTPAFGVVVPSFWMLVGLIMTINFFTYHVKMKDLEPEDGPVSVKAFTMFLVKALSGGIAVGFGWMIH